MSTYIDRRTAVTIVDSSGANGAASSANFVTGASPAMRALDRVIADIAPTDIPVLLIGESGTGKEAIAREIHGRSRHSRAPFLKCNGTAANLDALLAGPIAGDAGLRAGGTLFLDEVSLFELANQRALLQILSDADREPPEGGMRARIISATSKNLEEEMRAGRFPQELYYRINGVCLRLPCLRHRKEDIPDLLAFFLRKYATVFNRSEPQLEPATVDLLLRHSWPGNIRELENVARKIVALGDERLALEDLAGSLSAGSPVPSERVSLGDAHGNARSLKEASREASRKAERELILQALDRTHWNRKRTARELQISYKALLYKLKQLNLDGTSNS